ncbi:MAG: DUF932 domain-containing protein [Gemmataceae bacterium]
MATANLMLHRGAREVSREELAHIPLPPATRSWAPVGHSRVLDTTLATLKETGFVCDKMRLALSADGRRFFGTLDLTTELSSDGIVTLAVGVRNSIDKTFPMGFCAGSRVFVCDNLAFRSELMVRRKHSINGAANFSADIATAVMGLNAFKESETARIAAMAESEMSNERAESFILRAAVERGIISLRQIPAIIREWREPRHEVFEPRTAWSLFNAFTSGIADMQKRNPAELARRTMRLSALLTPEPVTETTPPPVELAA